ncbi:hypothetical protein EB796_024802 [Bugula neritina]|uniref:Uncharacterized protein n=1 Tax=Bugula neritina TaxID=10212 RepID=A0A7J7ISG8_BUGNE|nr:hypothetical protein EB796_024802 [Bugula neritina]
MTSYNVVDGQEDIAEESIAVTSIIQSMLISSQLTEIDFQPTYAFVATWYKSIAFPYIWYDAAGYQEFTSYQAVIATDGTRTYLMYIYPSGPNQVYLRRLNEFRNIYMGYNAQDGVNLFSVYVSTTSEIVGLHTEPSNTEVAGRWVFSVSDTDVPSPYAQRCIDWYLGAKATYPYGVGWNAPCPCTSAVARRDFTFWFDSSTNCAYSLFRLGAQNNYLMCCYSSLHNSLLSGPEDAGFPISYSPFLSPTLFAQNDLSPFGDCCAYSDYCALFREFKPILTCVGYSPPRPASQFGEPHIYTLDGYLYTYNPIGEFWMIKSDYFLVQARTVQSVNDQEQLVLATQIQAYAMQSIRPLPFTDRVLPDNVSDIIHVELNNNHLLLYRNGESWTHLIDSTVDETLLSFNGGTIRKANESLTVVFDSGFTFRLFARFGILNCQNLVPELARGKVAGLLGDYDGDIENDITDSSGKLVCTPANCTSQIIHQLFGESWRINASESILWYRSGWNSATYTDLTFVPLYFDMTTVNQTVQDVCNNDQTCMYDTITMDSSDVGIYTSLVRGEIQDLSVTFSNTPPSVTGPTRIDARISQAVTASYTYSDADGDSVSLVVTSSPPGANVVESPGTWTITWTPVDFNPVSLSMYAVEDLPVNGENITSVELVVMFRITPDCQNGEPDYDLLAPSGTVTSLFSVYTCNCSLAGKVMRVTRT